MNQSAVKPPAERDLFTLAADGTSFDELLEAFKTAPESGPETSVPERAVYISQLILNESVRLVRLGSRSEIAEAAVELTEMALIPEEEREGGYANTEAAQNVEAASTMLGAAGLRSSGFEYNLLRKRDDGEWPLATKMLATLNHLVKTKENEGRAEVWPTLKEMTDSLVEQGDVFDHNARVDLEEQGLMVSVRGTQHLYFYPRKLGTELPHVTQVLALYEYEQQL